MYSEDVDVVLYFNQARISGIVNKLCMQDCLKPKVPPNGKSRG